jgi:arylformamidase
MSWQGKPREWLDREYNARATVPDIFPIIAWGRDRTDAAKAALRWERASYGPTEPERLDIYPAAAKGPAPVFVYIHGGYWRLLDADDSGFMAPAFSALGAVTVAVNYALAPAVTLEEIVRQCRAAMAWLRQNIARFGGDPDRIHIAGSSAGGHLAAMLAREEGVASATMLSGLMDLEPLVHCHVNDWLNLTPERARALSPLQLPPPPAGRPLIFSVAPSETSEFKRHTAQLAAAWRSAGCDVTMVEPPPDSNHFDLPYELCDLCSALMRAVRRAMRL